MIFWGHSFRGFGSVERICWACGYVIDRGLSEEGAKEWIRNEEGCDLHCGGDWHVFKRIPTTHSQATGEKGS